MYEQFKHLIIAELSKNFSVDQLRKISECLDLAAKNFDVVKKETQIVPYGQETPKAVEIYIASKKIEGLSEKSLYLYLIVLKDFFRFAAKPPEKVSANDIRIYLYQYQKEHGISNRTLDTRRTVLCSFFNWMAAEEYISKNPAIHITPIKYERKHKKSMTQMDLEKVRMACETKREKAIVELLYSTGCRVSELCNLNITDVNFETKEVTLFGKGSKHRTSYINARAEVALKEYLQSRSDESPALIVHDTKPHIRMKKSGIERVIRMIMARTTGVGTHVTPHVFRHTTATIALDRGMSIVDVSRLLGHKNLGTTMEYITANAQSVKDGHNNFVI